MTQTMQPLRGIEHTTTREAEEAVSALLRLVGTLRTNAETRSERLRLCGTL